jgi:hypothetical protein
VPDKRQYTVIDARRKLQFYIFGAIAFCPAALSSVLLETRLLEAAMIVRIFRVWVQNGKQEEWRHMVEEHSIPWMKSQNGILAFYPGMPINAVDHEFSMTSIWTSVEAIRQAVGENWKEAILFGDEAAIADRIEMHYYEVFGFD